MIIDDFCERDYLCALFGDTLKSTPPECKQMKKADVLGITVMAGLFLACGGLGYAAFGDKTPGNILTGFGFYELFWLVDIGKLCIVIHMVGAYQIVAQAFFLIVEMGAKMMWPDSGFVQKEYPCRIGKSDIQF
ncbi:hypothetical protein QN277_017494 [Acacia crassicarpa]|uniref:Amino acid transporter transmembrane domain-containing protein n=1 Tax=Acacia crassicarpa TaxID=499986 RepID=A0AAE1MQK7_9FABA|nr:hypothetical protein QN277_017494 [Acacia crassicarpa]